MKITIETTPNGLYFSFSPDEDGDTVEWEEVTIPHIYDGIAEVLSKLEDDACPTARQALQLFQEARRMAVGEDD